jgi:hypothetical protein
MPFSASKCTCRKTWHPRFLRLLPRIYDYAIPAFRDLQRDEREEAVQETVAQAFVLFVRLMRRRRAELVFPTIIARFAIARVRDGRTLGTSLNSRDVSFDQVCFRIDFPEWLARLSRRNRRIAESLACGNSTNHVARIPTHRRPGLPATPRAARVMGGVSRTVSRCRKTSSTTGSTGQPPPKNDSSARFQSADTRKPDAANFGHGKSIVSSRPPTLTAGVDPTVFGWFP